MATLKVVLLLGIVFFAALAMAQAGEVEKETKDIGEMKRCRCCYWYNGRCQRYCCSAPDGTVTIVEANEKETEESKAGGYGGCGKYGCCWKSPYGCKKCCSSPDEKPVEIPN